MIYKKISLDTITQIFFQVLVLSRIFFTEFFPFPWATKYFKWGAAVALCFPHDDSALMSLAFWPDSIARPPITSLAWDTLSPAEGEQYPRKMHIFWPGFVKCLTRVELTPLNA